MASIFDHLHIKRNTMGSSNELSFDVLDAARSEVNAKPARQPLPPKAYKGSYHGVAGTSTLSGKAEVEKRKKARRMHAAKLWVVGGALAFAAAFALLWFGYQHYKEVQDFSVRFDSLVNQFSNEDVFLAEVDGLMSSLEDEKQTQERAAAAERVDDGIQNIERTKANARSAKIIAVSERDRNAIDQILEAADARVEMLQTAKEAFALAAARDKRTAEAQQIWDGVVVAVQAAKEASDQANGAITEEETRKARDKTQSAVESLDRALEGLKTLASSDSSMDLSAQVAYVEQKRESLEYGKQTADALLEGDREKAAAFNERYNETDSQAAGKAQKLPLTLKDVVYDAYAPQFAELSAEYIAARYRVMAADAKVNDYLAAVA